MKSLTIIGAGLAGSLLALYMVKRGYKVVIYEARSDPRFIINDKGRSINLALSCRGLSGLNQINLEAAVGKITAIMRARAIHEIDGSLKFQAFGRHEDEYINAIQRSDLNKLLLDKLEEEPEIELYFDKKLLELNIVHKLIHLENKGGPRETQSYEVLIGADGASSQVRTLLSQKGVVVAERVFLPHGYKELSIAAPEDNHYTAQHLHLWPRDSFMLLGNPNKDNSLTGTLFLAEEGKSSFSELEGQDKKIADFFKKEFSDAYQTMPNLIQEFNEHPRGHLSTIHCTPWYVDDHCLLIGDAAHGIVPFFGQGMNSAFEDCRILNELLDQYKDDWKKVIPAFFKARKINTDAIARMSMDNYQEIQQEVRDKKFHLKKQIEHLLMQRYPDCYISKHIMVMFTNKPYIEALEQGYLQDELLEQITASIKNIEEADWQKIDLLMKNYDKKLTKSVFH